MCVNIHHLLSPQVRLASTVSPVILKSKLSFLLPYYLWIFDNETPLICEWKNNVGHFCSFLREGRRDLWPSDAWWTLKIRPHWQLLFQLKCVSCSNEKFIHSIYWFSIIVIQICFPKCRYLVIGIKSFFLKVTLEMSV